MKARLLAVGGDVKATEISLTLPAVVGRGRDATLTLPHPLVSRKHCELFDRDGVLMVRDLGSLNGTYIGSQRVTEGAIPSGELLTIATVNFRVVYSTSEVGDDTDAPLGEGNDDSTHGPGMVETSSTEPSDSEGRRRRDETSHPAGDKPIERDTEWQVGNVPPKRKSAGDDDLSSFLNDPQ
jgi:pSer/pThr/pTyr-binding forkhead associated (FHA) protein